MICMSKMENTVIYKSDQHYWAADVLVVAEEVVLRCQCVPCVRLWWAYAKPINAIIFSRCLFSRLRRDCLPTLEINLTGPKPQVDFWEIIRWKTKA